MLEEDFPGIPVQLCKFHQCKTITKYITKNPKSGCGQALKDLMFTLRYSYRTTFEYHLNEITEQYQEFLEERNENNEYKHRRIRSAIRSLKTNMPYLFQDEDFPDFHIPPTTNSCDGYFSHLKSKVRLHRGIEHNRKKKLIEQLLLQNYPVL